MARLTVTLLLSGLEALIMTLIGYITLTGIMSSSTYYAPSSRWALDMQLGVLLLTLIAQLFIAVQNKFSFIVSTFPTVGGGDNNSNENDSSSVNIRKSDAAAGVTVVRPTAQRYLLMVANAYCWAIFTFFVIHFTGFMQGVAFNHTLDDYIEPRLSKTSNHMIYNSSQQSDWIQAMAGGSDVGWQRFAVGTRKANGDDDILDADADYIYYHTVDSSSAPLLGMIFFGVVSAYLFVMVLLAVYGSYAATPEGEYAEIFFSSRGLLITNGMVSFLIPALVEKVFSNCEGEGSSWVGPSVWALIISFEEPVISLMLWFIGDYIIGDDRGEDMAKTYYEEGLLQPIWISFLAIMPPVFAWITLVGDITVMPVIICISLILSIFSIIAAWVDYYKIIAEAEIMMAVEGGGAREIEYAQVVPGKNGENVGKQAPAMIQWWNGRGGGKKFNAFSQQQQQRNNATTTATNNRVLKMRRHSSSSSATAAAALAMGSGNTGDGGTDMATRLFEEMMQLDPQQLHAIQNAHHQMMVDEQNRQQEALHAMLKNAAAMNNRGVDNDINAEAGDSIHEAAGNNLLPPTLEEIMAQAAASMYRKHHQQRQQTQQQQQQKYHQQEEIQETAASPPYLPQDSPGEMKNNGAMISTAAATAGEGLVMRRRQNPQQVYSSSSSSTAQQQQQPGHYHGNSVFQQKMMMQQRHHQGSGIAAVVPFPFANNTKSSHHSSAAAAAASAASTTPFPGIRRNGSERADDESSNMMMRQHRDDLFTINSKMM